MAKKHVCAFVCMSGVVGGMRAIAEESGETQERHKLMFINRKLWSECCLQSWSFIHTGIRHFFRDNSCNIQTYHFLYFANCFLLSVTFQCSEFRPLHLSFWGYYWWDIWPRRSLFQMPLNPLSHLHSLYFDLYTTLLRFILIDLSLDNHNSLLL